MLRHGGRSVVVAVVAVMLVSCAAGRAFKRGQQAAMAGDWDTAVAQYRRALQEDPDRPEYKIALERAMQNASRQHLERARVLEQKGQLEEAVFEYRKATEYEPTNRQAAAQAATIERSLREKLEAARPRPKIEEMREQARRAISPPVLNPASREPLRVRFTNASLKSILDFIADASGINIIYDQPFTDRPFTIDLRDATLEEALTQILTANTLFYKVLNPTTIIVAQDNTAKRAQYEEQVVRTFYLSHADPAEVSQILSAVLRLPNMGVQPQYGMNKVANSVTVRASVAVMDIIERIIRQNDKPRAEIVIDVSILEVNRNRAKQFGINLSDYALGGIFSPELAPLGQTTGAGQVAAGTVPSQVTGPPPFNLNTISQGVSTADFYLAVPAAVVKFLESDSQTRLVAKPQLRGSEGQKLVLNLGDEIPVITTAFTPIAGGGATVNPLQSYQYKPVGVIVEMTPRVTLEGEVVLELLLESSSLGQSIEVAGTRLPTFGTRKVTTKLRLRDGEPNLLAGLLREDERRSLRGFPGLLRVPVLKQLLASNDNAISQTDIVMLLTPHIIRGHELTQDDLNPIYIGTQQNLGLSGPPPLIAPPPEVPGGAGVALPPAPVPVPPPGTSPVPGMVMPPTPAKPGEPVPGTRAAEPPTAPTEIALTPPGELRAGIGPYTVPITINNATRLATIALTVTYNPAVLRVRAVQEGSFMRSGGANVSFTQQVDPAAGRVDLALARVGPMPGATGGGLLAAIVFDAIAPGTSTLTPSGVATDAAGVAVALLLSPATVTVK